MIFFPQGINFIAFDLYMQLVQEINELTNNAKAHSKYQLLQKNFQSHIIIMMENGNIYNS